MMVRVAVLSGSGRTGSYNTALVRLAAARVEAAGGAAEMIDLAALNLPLYAPAIEAAAFPATALALKARLRASDAFIIATPEHNGSISALLKNALDWASRPIDGEAPLALSAFRGKVAAIMAASTGPFGGLRALAHLRQILGTVQMLVVPEQLAVPLAAQAFDDDGALRDPLAAGILDTLATRAVDVAARLHV